MSKKLNPAKSGVDLQQFIGPHPRTGRNVVIINSVELNILFGGRKMKNPYLLGLLISLLVGAATVAIKSSITRYPGLGDFFLFYGVAEGLVRTGIGERIDVSGEIIVYG